MTGKGNEGPILSRAVLRVENRHCTSAQTQKQEQTPAKAQSVPVESQNSPVEDSSPVEKSPVQEEQAETVQENQTEIRIAPAESAAMPAEAFTEPAPTEARITGSRLAAVLSLFAHLIPDGKKFRSLIFPILSRFKIYRFALIIFWIRRFVSARRWLVATTVVCGLVLAMIVFFRPTASDETEILFDEPILVFEAELNPGGGQEAASDDGKSNTEVTDTGASVTEGGPLLVPGTSTPGKSVPIVSKAPQRKHGGAWLTGTIETISEDSPLDRTARSPDIYRSRQ